MLDQRKHFCFKNRSTKGFPQGKKELWIVAVQLLQHFELMLLRARSFVKISVPESVFYRINHKLFTKRFLCFCD